MRQRSKGAKMMKKFIALYMTPIAGMDEIRKNMTPERVKEMNESWLKWAASHEKSFVDVGSPTGKNKRVSKDKVQDVRNEVTGFSVVQAETHEEATKIFRDNRGGPGCLNSFSASISGASAGVRLPRGGAAY